MSVICVQVVRAVTVLLTSKRSPGGPVSLYAWVSSLAGFVLGLPLRVMVLSLLVVTACVRESPEAGSMNASGRPDEHAHVPRGIIDKGIAGFDELFEIIRRIPLQETTEVLNVAPMLRVDMDGGFLVADRREQQIRRYRGDGSLDWRFGSRGTGPAEFESPTVALRLDSAHVMAMDVTGRGFIWNVLEQTATRTLTTNLRVEDADLIDAKTVLYSTRPAVAEGDVPTSMALHILDLNTGAVVRRFLKPTISDQNRRAFAIAGWSSSLFWNDTIATVVSLMDTVFLSSAAGVPIAKIKYPTRRFKTLEQGVRLPNGRVNLTTVSLSTDIHRLSDGVLVVQFQEIPNNVPVFHLVAFDRNGRRAFEMYESPRLWAIENDVFYFTDPQSPTPNVIVAARSRNVP